MSISASFRLLLCALCFWHCVLYCMSVPMLEIRTNFYKVEDTDSPLASMPSSSSSSSSSSMDLSNDGSKKEKAEPKKAKKFASHSTIYELTKDNPDCGKSFDPISASIFTEQPVRDVSHLLEHPDQTYPNFQSKKHLTKGYFGTWCAIDGDATLALRSESCFVMDDASGGIKHYQSELSVTVKEKDKQKEKEKEKEPEVDAEVPPAEQLQADTKKESNFVLTKRKLDVVTTTDEYNELLLKYKRKTALVPELVIGVRAVYHLNVPYQFNDDQGSPVNRYAHYICFLDVKPSTSKYSVYYDASEPDSSSSDSQASNTKSTSKSLFSRKSKRT